MAFLDAIGLGFVYRPLKDAVGAVWRRYRPLPNTEKIALRLKWKRKLDKLIHDNHARKLRRDVIIRDVRRIDRYPDTDESAKGISPWFRMGLVGTYHRGIYVLFEWRRLVEVSEGKYFDLDTIDHGKDSDELEKRAIKVAKLGLIPFENIEEVDFEGDEHYPYPHIYCHFAIKRRPYEKVAFFKEDRLFGDALPYYKELTDIKIVKWGEGPIGRFVRRTTLRKNET